MTRVSPYYVIIIIMSYRPFIGLRYYRAMCFHRADYAMVRCLSVCPSVCSPCGTRRYCVEWAKYIIKLFFTVAYSHTFYFYHTKPYGNPPTGSS